MRTSPEWNKFYILGAVGGTTPTAEDLFYHWGVVHATLLLGSKSPIENFVRYAQNYVNPDVPDDARLVRRHPKIRYSIFSDHWANSWQNVEQSILDDSHRNRLGRHHFGDPSALQVFFGRGGPVYRTEDFAHPAGLTIGHWLGLPAVLSRADALARLEVHKNLVAAKLKEHGRSCKYTVDICDADMNTLVEGSSLKSFPRSSYFVVELMQFAVKDDAFDFTEKYKPVLRDSYATFADPETSHSVYGIERIVLDFTDENPSTKTPKPVFFTDKNSVEYKVMHNDWRVYEPCFRILEDTAWASHATDQERDQSVYVKALDPNTDWK